MSDCRDCVKGHCDRWDHLVEIVRLEAVEIDKPLRMAFNEIQRCACGGSFVYRDAKMQCSLCGGSLPEVDRRGVPVESEVGLPLDEVLRRMRRRAAPRWTPSDADVKVTVSS